MLLSLHDMLIIPQYSTQYVVIISCTDTVTIIYNTVIISLLIVLINIEILRFYKIIYVF